MLKELLQRYKEKKEKERSFAEDRRIQQNVVDKEKSSNERELEKYMKEEREENIRKELEYRRKKRSEDINKTTLWKNDNMFGGKDYLFGGKATILNGNFNGGEKKK